MAQTLFSEPRFTNDDAAREHLESIRWPNGAICPHCGGTERNSRLQGKAHRPGLWFCGDCRTQFTVTVGTVFERSKVPLHKWLLANHLMCSSKKGISAHQLHRTLGVTYKTAWFMAFRIREAMTDKPTGKLGGGGKTVEADEAYWGNNEAASLRKMHGKMQVMALVERGGSSRTFHIRGSSGALVRQVIEENVERSSILNTDESKLYGSVGREFAAHETVNHRAGEYSRGDVTTNTVESYFAILKRGLIGTYHHVAEKHLQRYCNEFDFKYSTRSALGIEDNERANLSLKGISGKRLTYRRASRNRVA